MSDNTSYKLVTDMLDTLTESDIRIIAGAVQQKIQSGEKIFNLTIGDFNPKIFPVPEECVEEIFKAYKDNQTNYPFGPGEPVLRNTLSEYMERRGGLKYNPNEFVIGAGGRPNIYLVYNSVVEKGDGVIFPVPSWNNNFYIHILGAKGIPIETKADSFFMPSAEQIKPHIKNASLIALCSPLNPTGTVLQKENIENISTLVVEENATRRKSGKRPIYVLFDQIYWQLTYGVTKHYDPVTVNPEMKKYTLFTDGMSKAFAGTGVRVGWLFGDEPVISKTKSMLTHLGSFPPKPEQIAAGIYLKNDDWVDKYLNNFKNEISTRLSGFHKGFMDLKKKGYPVNAIVPMAALYLTIEINLLGKNKPGGGKFETPAEVTKFILDDAKIGLVPFSAFDSVENPTWYRLSVGTCTREEVGEAIYNLEKSLEKIL